MTIDSHVHFWKYNKKRDAWITDEMRILKQDYLPEHLSLSLKRNGVDGCIAVQADQSELETHFLIELAKTNPVINGVVGWIDLQNKNLEERLSYFSQYKVIKGWRHIVQAEPDDFLLNPDFLQGIKKLSAHNYTYDVLVYHHQLKQAATFVEKFPEQKFVIDHCAKPDIKNKKLDEWKVWMKHMAQYPNVCCKLSGLLTEATLKEWRPGDFYPYLDVVFDVFGTDRLLYGSDWPVMLLSGIYVQWKSLLEKYMENFNEEEQEKVFGLNAIKFYNLK
ncbi:MAG TPA: amidohydrolase family protein [Chitinophagaceae bacterium]|nr:amidohydrolase family protein [Chitinophagaceae bacterium]